jgi:hypothetical protein
MSLVDIVTFKITEGGILIITPYMETGFVNMHDVETRQPIRNKGIENTLYKQKKLFMELKYKNFPWCDMLNYEIIISLDEA